MYSHEHPLLQVSPGNAFIIPSVLKDSSCGDVRWDCIKRRFACGVCGVILSKNTQVVQGQPVTLQYVALLTHVAIADCRRDISGLPVWQQRAMARYYCNDRNQRISEIGPGLTRGCITRQMRHQRWLACEIKTKTVECSGTRRSEGTVIVCQFVGVNH